MRGAIARCTLGAALLVGVAATGAAQTVFAPGQDPLAGSRVFGAKGCARCHAVSGVGGKIGPDLGRMERPRSFYDLAAALWNHAPRMADRMRQLGIARPQLDARESADLVAFLFTADYFDRPGNAETGRRLFTEKRCIACHQVRGAGGVLGPNLDSARQQSTPIYLAAEMWNHGPQMAALMAARKLPRPTFTGGELRDLIAYVGAGAPRGGDEPLYLLPGNADDGRRLFVEKSCVACHGIPGQGGKVAPDLGERPARRSPIDFAAAMWNKAPLMTAAMKRANVPVPNLRPAEMADIVAYLYSLRYLAPAGDASRGLGVATAKGCLGCHAVGGGRGKAASDLTRAHGADTPGGVLSALWNHSFLGDPKLVAGRSAWASMSAEELANLVAFLQSARRP